MYIILCLDVPRHSIQKRHAEECPIIQDLSIQENNNDKPISTFRMEKQPFAMHICSPKNEIMVSYSVYDTAMSRMPAQHTITSRPRIFLAEEFIAVHDFF